MAVFHALSVKAQTETNSWICMLLWMYIILENTFKVNHSVIYSHLPESQFATTDFAAMTIKEQESLANRSIHDVQIKHSRLWVNVFNANA